VSGGGDDVPPELWEAEYEVWMESCNRLRALLNEEQAILPRAEFEDLQAHVIGIAGWNDDVTPADEGMAAALDLLEHRRRNR
jgi:hypothetical protein